MSETNLTASSEYHIKEWEDALAQQTHSLNFPETVLKAKVRFLALITSRGQEGSQSGSNDRSSPTHVCKASLSKEDLFDCRAAPVISSTKELEMHEEIALEASSTRMRPRLSGREPRCLPGCTIS